MTYNKNSKHKMLVESMIFYKNLNKFMEHNLAHDSQFSVSDLFFLFYLEDKKSATYYQLSQSLPYNNSYISKTIKKMEAKGFIVREAISNKKVIKLTEIALETLSLREEKKDDILKIFENNGMTVEELRTFFLTMTKFSKILSNFHEN